MQHMHNNDLRNRVKFVHLYRAECSYSNMTKVEIKCTKDGPNLIVVNGNIFGAMCRCGAADTKPYCDGSHAKIGFKAEAKEITVSE